MHYQAGPFFLNTFDFHKNFPNTNFEEKSGFAQFGWQLLDLSFHANATAICRKISRISPRRRNARFVLILTQENRQVLLTNGLSYS